MYAQDAPWDHSVKTLRHHPQNRGYITNSNPEEDRATATGNMHMVKYSNVVTRADKQTNKWTYSSQYFAYLQRAK